MYGSRPGERGGLLRSVEHARSAGLWPHEEGEEEEWRVGGGGGSAGGGGRGGREAEADAAAGPASAVAVEQQVAALEEYGREVTRLRGGLVGWRQCDLQHWQRRWAEVAAARRAVVRAAWMAGKRRWRGERRARRRGCGGPATHDRVRRRRRCMRGRRAARGRRRRRTRRRARKGKRMEKAVTAVQSRERH